MTASRSTGAMGTKVDMRVSEALCIELPRQTNVFLTTAIRDWSRRTAFRPSRGCSCFLVLPHEAAEASRSPAMIRIYRYFLGLWSFRPLEPVSGLICSSTVIVGGPATNSGS
jgi:hypothetical protein